MKKIYGQGRGPPPWVSRFLIMEEVEEYPNGIEERNLKDDIIGGKKIKIKDSKSKANQIKNLKEEGFLEEESAHKYSIKYRIGRNYRSYNTFYKIANKLLNEGKPETREKNREIFIKSKYYQKVFDIRFLIQTLIKLLYGGDETFISRMKPKERQEYFTKHDRPVISKSRDIVKYRSDIERANRSIIEDYLARIPIERLKDIVKEPYMVMILEILKMSPTALRLILFNNKLSASLGKPSNIDKLFFYLDDDRQWDFERKSDIDEYISGTLMPFLLATLISDAYIYSFLRKERKLLADVIDVEKFKKTENLETQV